MVLKQEMQIFGRNITLRVSTEVHNVVAVVDNIVFHANSTPIDASFGEA